MSLDLGGTGQDLTSAFTYNPANQIASQTRDNDNYAWAGHYNVNRTDVINGLNQVTSSGSTVIGYDGRGNLTSSGSDLYAYSADNRLISGNGGAALTYDAIGRLSESSKAGVTTKYQYDGTDLVAEYNGANAIQRRYVHSTLR